MREILFRGKSIEPSTEGKWWCGSLLVNGSYCYILPENPITPLGIVKYRVDPETVGQSTGMTDKTGKKIFEGDIIKWIDSDGNNRIDKVLFSNGGFHLCNIYYNIGGYKGNSLEVIGNIHDNKELLS